MIINQKIKNIVSEIEQSKKLPTDKQVIELLSTLKNQLALPENKSSVDSISRLTSDSYPVDVDGYAKSFDPINDEEGLVDTWNQFGIVVVKQIVTSQQCDQTIKAMNQLVADMSTNTCSLNKSETWSHIPKDSAGVSFISRGFFELYHDHVLAQIRQSVRHYIAEVLIWRRYDLWTSFDRLGIKLPEHAESKALALHVDQNPKIHKSFKTVQGVIALADCPVERGTFVAAVGSRNHFLEYKQHAPDKGEYVELPKNLNGALWIEERLQAFPLRKGDMVLWDSRTTHANTENISQDIRYVAYVAAGPAREQESELVAARRDACISGVGSNNREALMHASKKPRYQNPEIVQSLRTPEELSLLGKLMYGIETYEKNIT